VKKAFCETGKRRCNFASPFFAKSFDVIKDLFTNRARYTKRKRLERTNIINMMIDG